MQPRRSAQSAEVFEHVPEFKTVDASRVSRPQFESKRSDDVVEMNIKPALAFEHFAGRISQPPRNATESTASDEARSQLYRQLAAQQTEFAALPSSLGARRALFESPFQRLHRLRTEVAEFQTDLEQMSQPTVYGASADDVEASSGTSSSTVQGASGGGRQSSSNSSSSSGSMLNDACAAVADQLRALERELGQAALDSRMQPMATLLASGSDSADRGHSSASSAASVDHILAHLARWRRGGATEGTADVVDKSDDAKPAAATPSVTDRPHQVTYELYLDQSTSAPAAGGSASGAAHAQARLVNWEQRIAALETLVGPASLMPPLASLERMTGAGASSSSTAFSSSSAAAAAAAASSSSTRTTSATAAATASGSLGALIPFLMQRLDLLDKVKIDAVQRRIKILLADVDALLAARLRVSTAIDASSLAATATAAGGAGAGAGAVDASIGANGKGATAHELRVRDLHAALLRWDAAAQQLPAVIARLRSLAALHEQSAHAVTRLEACERQIRGAEQLLQTDAQLMAQLESSMLENARTMQANSASLEARMAALAIKMEALR